MYTRTKQGGEIISRCIEFIPSCFGLPSPNLVCSPIYIRDLVKNTRSSLILLLELYDWSMVQLNGADTVACLCRVTTVLSVLLEEIRVTDSVTYIV